MTADPSGTAWPLLLLTAGASLLVSSIAGVSATLPLVQRHWLTGRLPAAASFAAGVLIGDAFLHLLPESLHRGLPEASIGPWLTIGLLAFFAVECTLRLAPRMMATASRDEQSVVIARMDIVGDVVHHAMDGLLIGAAFLVSVAVGAMTVIAIALHEVVRKFGVSGVLLMSGMAPRRALAIVWINTLACPVGACALLVLSRAPQVMAPVLAAVAGGAIYLACSDFLPSAWQASGIKAQPGIVVGLGAGILAIWLCEALAHVV